MLTAKKDNDGNNYTMGKDKTIWLYIRHARAIVRLGDLKKNKLRVYRTSYDWRPELKGWMMPYPVLKMKRSFPFLKVWIVTAATPKMNGFTGVLSRRELSRRPIHQDKLLGRCVLLKRQDLKRKYKTNG